MKRKGTITTWKENEGFGFIAPDDDSGEVFFHITALAKGQRRPMEKMPVTYAVEYDEDDRPYAVNIFLGYRWTLTAIVTLVIAVFTALAVMTLSEEIKVWTPVAYLVMSVITFWMYGSDKAKARNEERRTPEKTLHALELFGGWPGALVAQQYYRHKNKKGSYQFMYWLIVLIHLGVWSLFLFEAPWMHATRDQIVALLQPVPRAKDTVSGQPQSTRSASSATNQGERRAGQTDIANDGRAAKQVHQEAVGGSLKKSYTILLQAGEVVVGYADTFQTFHQRVAFLIIGPGEFTFSLANGLWYQWTNTNASVQERLLQEQREKAALKYHLDPSKVDTVRVP
jgi:uncharacterized membrane protein YsdA (DUF1294 family)/cold shock CspA family protein